MTLAASLKEPVDKLQYLQAYVSKYNDIPRQRVFNSQRKLNKKSSSKPDTIWENSQSIGLQILY